MRRIRRAVLVAGAVTLGGLAILTSDTTATPVPAAAESNAATNRSGRWSLRMGTCKYGVQGPTGFLQAVIWPPVVKSPNLRRGVVDSSWARYRAVLRDVNTGTTLSRTGWSGWLESVDYQSRTWTGKTVMPRWDWRGNYQVAVKV